MNKNIHSVLLISALFLFSACAPQEPPAAESTAAITSVTASEKVSETPAPAETEKKEEENSPEENMTVLSAEEKVGQILLGKFPGDNAEEVMEKYQLGGFTLYAGDFRNETPDTISAEIEKIQSKAKIPAFMAVDEEGGTIVRVSKFPQYRPLPFESQIALARGGEELVKSGAEEKAKLLLSLGINFNLAPVADFTEDHQAYIFDRTFGCDAETTALYTALTVEVMNENKMGSCLKHFPGYGSNSDTHTGSSADDRIAEELESADLIPFRRGIEAGAPAVMVSHNIVKAFDSELPASLSPAVHDFLRNELGFEGVIVTDDLIMDAIGEYSGDESPYVLAVTAGNDLICTSDTDKAYSDILAAVKDGRIAESRLDESIERIIKMKRSLGIIAE